MIATAARLVARSLIEAAILLIALAAVVAAIGGLIGYGGYRILRRVATDKPDRLDAIAGPAFALAAGLAAARRRKSADETRT